MKMSDDGPIDFSFKPKKIGQFKTPLTPKVKSENDNKVYALCIDVLLFVLLC